MRRPKFSAKNSQVKTTMRGKAEFLRKGLSVLRRNIEIGESLYTNVIIISVSVVEQEAQKDIP